jgi:hypothetical protein
MKKIATVISAASLAVVSASASAWGWGNDGWGYNGYGYAPYGYAPYGYGVPVAPAAEMTEEQKQAIADQQARALEYMQNAQKYAAEFYASQRAPMLDMQTVMEEREARFKEIDAEREASRQAYEARVAESKAAYEARRKEREAALKARMERHNRKPAADTGA